MRLIKEIIKDYLILLNDENNLGYDIGDIHNKINNPEEFNHLRTLLDSELYTTEMVNGQLVSTERAFYLLCKVVVNYDIKSGRRIWNKFIRKLFLICERNSQVCLMAHRGSGKSYFVSLYIIFKMWLIPYYEVCYCSNVPKQQRRFMRNIEALIDGNEFLLEKKNIHGINSNKIPWGQQDMGYNSGILEGTSVGTTPRGGHFNLVFADDPLRDDQKYTYEYILNYFLGILMPTTFTKKARYIISGTPISGEDLFHVLMNEKLDKQNRPLGKPVKRKISHAGFYSQTFPAILNHQNKTVLIPEIWTYEKLMAQKIKMGEYLFSREMMCRISTFNNSLIGSALFRRCCDPELTLLQKGEQGKKYVIFVDSATSDAPRADYSAMTVWEDDEIQGKFILRHVLHQKGRPITDPTGGDEDQTNDLFQLYIDFNCARVAIEKNNAGIALIQSIQALGAKRGKTIEPIEHYTHNTKSLLKKGKADDVIDYIEQGLKAGTVVFPSNPEDIYTISSLEKVKYEHLNFGVKRGKSGEVWEALAGHDDLFDSCMLGFKFRSGNMETIPFAVTMPGSDNNNWNYN